MEQQWTYNLAEVSNILEHVEELVELADAAATQDPKLEQLVNEISEIRSADPS
jgi:NTP pyrophosphatase (non-canonical NTP hydrolase)